MANSIALTQDYLNRHQGMRPELKRIHLEHAKTCNHPGTVWSIELTQITQGAYRYLCSFCHENFCLEREAA